MERGRKTKERGVVFQRSFAISLTAFGDLPDVAGHQLLFYGHSLQPQRLRPGFLVTEVSGLRFCQLFVGGHTAQLGEAAQTDSFNCSILAPRVREHGK